MALFGKNNKSVTSRRDSVRKRMSVGEKASIRRRFLRMPVLMGLLYLFCFMSVSSVVLDFIRNQSLYREGRMLTEDITPRVDFEVENKERTQFERERKKREISAIYELNLAYLQEWKRLVERLPMLVGDVNRPEELDDAILQKVPLDEEAITTLKKYRVNDQVSPEWLRRVQGHIHALEELPIVRNEDYLKDYHASYYSEIKLINDRLSQVSPARDYSPTAEMLDLNRPNIIRDQVEKKSRASGLPAPIAKAFASSVAQSGQPTYVRNDQVTDEIQREALADMKPVMDLHQSDRVLIPKWSILDDEHLELLRQENMAFSQSRDLYQIWAPRVAMAALVLLLGLGMSFHTITVAPRILENSIRGFVVFSLLLSGIPLSWGLTTMSPYFDVAGPLIVLVTLAMLLSIAYGRRYAMGMVLMYGALLSISMHLSLAQFIVIALSAAVTVIQLDDLRQRAKLIRVGMVSGVVAAAGVLGAGFLEVPYQHQWLEMIGYQAVFSAASCIAVGFVVLGTLPLIEQIFRVTTSMTLLELCDVSQPLLRRLAEAAPGTYNHSLTMSMMSEKAAETIGANGLLCRVGALYHDIGKINKPGYFIENQAGGPNKHDKLSPAMSLLVIVGHVKDGMQMAREAGLPKSLWHFIESHHGTTLVEYFFHAAKEKRADDQQPTEIEFRYPGPKPQTKEAAIMMLCDCTESAARAMPEHTAPRIEQLVHGLAMKRLMDGQFDDCELTLQELSAIESSIVKSLVGMYHARIKYPEPASVDGHPELAVG